MKKLTREPPQGMAYKTFQMGLIHLAAILILNLVSHSVPPNPANV